MTLDALLKAALQGIPEAQYVVGLCYENGLGVDTDEDAAQEWFLKSAQAGFSAAQHELSLLLQAKGEEHLAEAVEWLRKSALQGFPLAQYLYSLYCEGGIGMASDPSEAFRYCLLAANRGYCPAARRAASMLEKGIGTAINLDRLFIGITGPQSLEISIQRRLLEECMRVGSAWKETMQERWSGFRKGKSEDLHGRF